jgi:hypothetical protein
MAKKTEVKYLKEDLEKMHELFRHVGPLRDAEQELIYTMLRKYIDPMHYRPLASCNCAMSYASCFNKLRDWCSQNANLFE